jgi:hypothetical protein
MQNILEKAGDDICIVKCLNQGTDEIHCQKSWNTEVYTILAYFLLKNKGRLVRSLFCVCVCACVYLSDYPPVCVVTSNF